MLGSAKTKLPLPTLTSWVKVASPFYHRWYLTGNKWFIHFISVSLWLAAQRTQRSQSQGSRARKGKRNESWLPLSSLVITTIKSRWLRPQLAFFQCSMIGWSLGCYPLTVSTYPGDDDEDEDDETFRPWHQSWQIMLKYLKLSVVQKGKLDLWQEFVEQPVAAMVSQTGLINTQISVKTQTHMQTQLCLKIATVCRWWQSLLVI